MIPKDTYSSKNTTAHSTDAATAAESSSKRISDRQYNFIGRGRGRWKGSQQKPREHSSMHQARYVQSGVVKLYGHSMGSEHSGTGILYPIQKPKISDVESVISTNGN
ncbi:hypothetical protein AYI70_g777 [Smittium culicis]|uniref:Uncharacterized protein n=1 Tax=Smittium culicis TaxID=133412 RepID=A0A1R1YFD5_9FUNG|nr:hypothetical protein AYI70_g777 [Smittium culicis]